MAEEKREYQLGISRCFDYEGNLKEQWLRASADTMEELETAYAILTQGVLAWPITLTSSEKAQETPPEDAEGQSEAQPAQNIRPAPKPTRTASQPATDKQCSAVLAICHGLSEDAVVKAFGDLYGEEADLQYTESGECLPTWSSLKTLGKVGISRLIKKLGDIE